MPTDSKKQLKRLLEFKKTGGLSLLLALTELESLIESKLLLSKGEKGDKGDIGEKGDKVTAEELLAIIKPLIPVVEDGRDGRDGRDGKDGTNGRDGENGKDGKDGNIKELSPEEVRDLLELLTGDKRLSINAIKDLRKELDELKKKRGETVFVGGGSGGRVVKEYDLTSQLNGVTKTFSLPGFFRVISVLSSSFPNAFRPTVDYTTNASSMSITFTDEIDAETTLASGQTIIVIYSE